MEYNVLKEPCKQKRLNIHNLIIKDTTMKHFFLFLILLIFSFPTYSQTKKMINKSNGTTDSFSPSDIESIKVLAAPAVDGNIVTGGFYGVNWADARDNFQSGVLYLSGLGSSDTYSSASIVADSVISQMMSLLGSNSVRMPINESTVNGSYWDVYTGAIDIALSKGKVILCYWSNAHGAKPANMTNFWNMWTNVINKYGPNGNAYFEVYNEPSAYSKTDLNNLYDEFVNSRFTGIPKNRIILDGTGMAQNVPDVGGDSRLSSCLLAVHDYSMWGYFTSESSWMSHISGEVGGYADRTICTEWGYPCSPGYKNSIYYDYIDYSPGLTSNYFYYYARGIATQLRSWGMGSFYWPGLRDGDWYSMTKKSGSGSSITLSVPNASALTNLKRAWGMTTSVERFSTDLPAHFNLDQNFPNPFNPSTTISFSLPSASFVSIIVYDALGRVMSTVVSEELSAGTYSRQWNCADLPSGVYFYRLQARLTSGGQAGSYIETKKLILLK
jgi:hypothetical protein